MSRCSVLTGLLCLVLSACAPNGAAQFDGRSAERAIENIEPGMLVISEVMIDPVDCPDLEGEWFELTNLTDSWLQLEGLTVTDADFYRSTMTRFELAPRASAVVQRGTDDTSCQSRFDVHAWFEGDVALNNSGDAIHLYNHKTGILIDQTPRFTEAHVVPGSSIQLQPDAHDPRVNDALENWYVGTDCPYDPQEPTPGEANAVCDVDAPAPADGWFDLTCQGYACPLPPTFDLTLHLAEAWEEAGPVVGEVEYGGDTLYFSNMHLDPAQPVRAADWFTAGQTIEASFEFAIPSGDAWGEDGMDWWVWIDVDHSDLIVEDDSSFGDEALLTRDASLGMLGGIGFTEAIQQLAASDPDFQIHWMRVQWTQGDAEARLVIDEHGTGRQAIWNVSTGQRLQ